MTELAGSGLELLPGERILRESDRGVLVLTNRRVRYDGVVRGEREIVGILLPDVVSCSVRRISSPVLGVLAALFALAALGANGLVQVAVPAMLATAFAGAYLASRKRVLAIASAGHVIELDATRLPLEEARDFLHALEDAKARQVKGNGEPQDGART